MGLEAAQYISDLVASWPLGTDKVREGDDHFRLLKRVLQASFPQISGPVTATHEQLSAIPADTSAVIEELKKHIVPTGVISMWSGDEDAVPDGWAICNGQTVDGYGVVPDLRDRFIIGASATKAIGSTGGEESQTTSGTGDHVHAVDSTVLTAGQLPAHTHALYVQASGGAGDTESFANAAAIAGNTNGTKDYLTVNGSNQPLMDEAGGGDEAHTHTMQGSGAHSHTVAMLPKYYALAYIIKTSEYEEPV